MCFGGGEAATITMPDTSAYDQQADLQIALMNQQSQGAMSTKQAELNTALTSQQDVLTELRDFKIQQANDTQANAARMAALIGAPPPDPTAKAPVIGRDRTNAKKAKGKKGLRIARSKKPSQGTGSGLNVTSTS